MLSEKLDLKELEGGGGEGGKEGEEAEEREGGEGRKRGGGGTDKVVF